MRWWPLAAYGRRHIATRGSFLIFQDFQTLKSKLVIFPMSKLHQFLQVDILEHKEKLSFLAQLKIPQDLKL
jgi:hypothetical protein